MVKSDDPHFRLRVPADLKEMIEAASKANTRSMNAEIIVRLEASFAPSNHALVEATLVAESLRKNLTDRMNDADKRIAALDRREANLDKREAELDRRDLDLDASLDEQLETRRQELEKQYEIMLASVRKRWKEADEYADFTVARERQFIETIKALTGVEPPAVEPIRRGESSEDKQD